MQNRRSFLKRSSLITLAPSVPGFLANYAIANRPSPDDRVLVVIQLDGGNDGVNTVIPYADEGYAKHRNELRIETRDLLKIDDRLGLNPAMRSAARMWEDGQLAIVPSVGYPNPNRSHEISMAIWQTCRFSEFEHNTYGWVGRSFDGQTNHNRHGKPSSMLIGDRPSPIALRGRRSVSSSLNSLEDFHLSPELQTLTNDNRPSVLNNDLATYLRRSQVQAYSMSSAIKDIANKQTNSTRYPATQLGNNLKTIATLLKADFGTRVFYTIQGGYDTHAAQDRSHGTLLSSLSRSIKSFLDDLRDAKLGDRVCVMCFSEFGRRVDENGSAGTDHGSAGLVMFAGANVKGGVHGDYSSLTDLDDGGLKVKTDFRQIYSSVLGQWLNVDTKPAFDGKSFKPLSLFD